jgi:hypothetical protein
LTFKDLQKLVQSNGGVYGTASSINGFLLDFRINYSGYLIMIRNNTNRNKSTFALTDIAAFGMALDVLRKMGRICLSYHIKRFSMKHFRITNTSGYSSLEGLAVASSF